MSKEKQMTKLTFLNKFYEDEVISLYAYVIDFMRNEKDDEVHSLKKFKADILNENNKTITITIKHGEDYGELVSFLKKLAIPYFIKNEEENINSHGEVFDGASCVKTLYDEKENLLGRMDAIIEAIALLEEDKEMQALVLLNQFATRTDIENMTRLTFPSTK